MGNWTRINAVIEVEAWQPSKTEGQLSEWINEVINNAPKISGGVEAPASIYANVLPRRQHMYDDGEYATNDYITITISGRLRDVDESVTDEEFYNFINCLIDTPAISIIGVYGSLHCDSFAESVTRYEWMSYQEVTDKVKGFMFRNKKAT